MYKIYFIHQDFYIRESFSNMQAAIRYGLTSGMAFRIDHTYYGPVYAWNEKRGEDLAYRAARACAVLYEKYQKRAA
jgi:hypothetical protein